MYVKVTADGPGGDFLTVAYPPIYSNYISAPLGPNAKWGEPPEGSGTDTVRVLLDPDIVFADVIGWAGNTRLHVLEFNPDQTEYEKNTGQIAFRYAWWRNPDEDWLTGVVTTRKIFILGENGKTIDRV